ncbi:carboxypeptidase M32 [Halorussus salilacus]|uniref:carboxypeptidase M32 n=1 Tax=Halorussus salilacus TaxID=2953750 RepID=UPI0020A181D6|nr:carboxypeptidase M32 [Halorussus salilacus]USZ69327.1 carboxypeptidase M32 [Halorussus salilacus]
MADAYDDLLERYERISHLRDGRGVLYWDQQVTMPEGGTPARSRQLSALSGLTHEKLTDDGLGDLLDAAEREDLDPEQAAVVREVRREHERAGEVPQNLVEELTRLQSEAQDDWREAKANDDFGAFAPTLDELVDLRTERAEHIDPGRDPYEVMFEDGEPHLGLETVERVFEELKAGLVPLVEEIRASDPVPNVFDGSFDEGTQRDLSEDALDLLGYDWDRGRLDTSAHPFTSGNQFDARVTTRFHEDDPIDALTATVHEFGHATYALGLQRDAYGSPLGRARSHGVHESQSRFWENHVGRTREFWELFLPTFKEHFPQVEGVTPEEAYRAANRVTADNCIRVEADELTYHMHIILRSEVEKAFVSGDLDVAEIPHLWNDKMEEYLGVRPDSDAEGCLQDIHWTGGFARFQNYTVGSVLAAQLWATIEDELDDPRGLILAGEFEPIHDWLTENVHRHGQRYTTDELIRRATGEDLTADYFLDYAEEKFGEIYGL